MPKIDDDIDTVLGLSVFYQYVRTAALNQQQSQHVGIFTTELFARYLHTRCRSINQFTEMSPNDEVQRYIKSVTDSHLPFIADVLSLKLLKISAQKRRCQSPKKHRENPSSEVDSSTLVEMLQQYAVELLTKYRQLQAQKFFYVVTIVTTDFEAMYAYKHGHYQQCFQLTAENVRTLLYADSMTSVPIFPEFFPLLDDDIVSLTALALIVDPEFRTVINRGQRRSKANICGITQLTLSLYLMIQCQLKLHHSVTSLSRTVNYIKVVRRRPPVRNLLDQLTLKLSLRKLVAHFSTTIPNRGR